MTTDTLPDTAVLADLPLFPLQTVLFPDGLLGLKVFEARYLDLMSACLRTGTPFGVVALTQGAEVRRAGDGSTVRFESTGTLASLLECDAPQAGLLTVKARGTRRFRLIGEARQQADGLWRAPTAVLAPDPVVAPDAARLPTVQGLATAIGSLRRQGQSPFLEPLRFDDAGWVANRWCEILPIQVPAKQRLMELQDPQARLSLVDEFLRGQGVIGGGA